MIETMPGCFQNRSAPLEKIKTGRLIFSTGVQDVRLVGGHDKGGLYHARFSDPPPVVHLQEGLILIQPASRLLLRNQRPPPIFSIDIRLNGAVAWEIEFRGYVSHLQADLRRLRLRSLDILGDASQVTLLLPPPEGTAFLYLSGAVRDSAIQRPARVGMRIHAGGGIEELRFDHQILRGVMAETSLESSSFSAENGYYDLTITGRVKSVIFTDTALTEHK